MLLSWTVTVVLCGCFIIILTTLWWKNCLCGNKYCVTHTHMTVFHWNSACLHLQTDYNTFYTFYLMQIRESHMVSLLQSDYT